MMDQKLKTIIAIAIVLVVVVWYWQKHKKEGYANIGDLDNIGSVNNQYEIINAPEEIVDGQHFADLVDVSAGMTFNGNTKSSAPRPMERLDRLQGSELLPRTSKGVTPFNIDVADPLSFSFQVNPPRVELKDPIRMQSDYFRGDIPITFNPNVSLVGKSRYGRDSLNLQGFFSPSTVALYDKYTGKGFKNMPLHVVNEEIVGDYTG